VLLRADHMLSPMKERCDLSANALVFLLDQGVCLEHTFQPPDRLAGLVPNRSKMLQVGIHVTLVPGGEDRLDVGKVLVQGRPSDARFLSDLQHRYRPQPLLRYQTERGFQDCIADLVSSWTI